MPSPEQALADARTGAMIALVPSAADAERLAADDGIPADELHVTLAFLGDAENWDEQARTAITTAVRELADGHDAVEGILWATAAINPTSDSPVGAYLVGDDTGALLAVRDAVSAALEAAPLPEQHSPYVPHISIAYGDPDTSGLDHVGSTVELDTLRVAFGGNATDFPLRRRAVPETAVADAAPRVPAWFEPDDPWLTEKMRQVGEIAAAERELGTALEKAVAVFLATAQARVLRRLPAGRITAAVDLNDWPERDTTWRLVVEQYVIPVLRRLFSRRYALMITVTVRLDAALDQFLAAARPRLATFVDDVFTEIREAQFAGADDTAIADLLRIDAPSRRRAQQMAALQDTIDDPATKDSVRREARSRLATLRRVTDRFGMRWWPKLAEMARTNAIAALNAGTAAGAAAEAETTGTPRFKQWWSAEDTRVRPAHIMAHGQVQPVGEWFSVGGFPMAYPGDPAAPADLTVNCRCSLLTLTASQAQQQRAAYEASHAARTDAAGRAIDTQGRVIATGPSTAGGVTMETDITDPVTEPVTAPEAEPETQPGHGTGPVTAAGREIPADQQAVRWRGMIAPLGRRSPDGRVLASPADGEPLLRILPLPLMYQEKTAPGHDDAVIVGNINDVWIDQDKQAVMGTGYLDLGSPDGREVARKIDRGFHRWVSVTHDPDASYSFRYFRDTGEEVPESDVAVIGPYNVAFDANDNELLQERTVHNWRLSDVTLVSTPAFEDAAIELLGDNDTGDERTAPVKVGDPVLINRRAAVVTDLDATDNEATVRIDENGEVMNVALTALVPRRTEASPVAASASDVPYYETITAEERRTAEEKGEAMPGGRYPIRNRSDLEKAIHAVGRAGGRSGTESERAAVRRHIIKRARALGAADMIPDTWNSDGSLKSGDSTKNSIKHSVEPGSAAWCERVAAEVPIEPPAAWFSDPKLTGPVKVMVTDEGRVYGHIAAWDTAHAGRPDVPSPPRATDRNYSKFHRHPVRCSDGTKVKTGPLATSGHEDINEPSVWKVMAHYDDPKFVVADVVCGEDEHGIWVSGALRYGITPAQVLMTDRYSFSGDWRGNELLAACSASVPGFHLDADDQVRALAASAGDAAIVAQAVPQMRVEDGEPVAIIAAGVLPPTARSRDALGSITVALSPSPEEWGARAFAAWEAAHEAHTQDLNRIVAEEQAREQRAAKIAEFRSRVTARRRAEVTRLRQRIGLGPKVDA